LNTPQKEGSTVDIGWESQPKTILAGYPQTITVEVKEAMGNASAIKGCTIIRSVWNRHHGTSWNEECGKIIL